MKRKNKGKAVKVVKNNDCYIQPKCVFFNDCTKSNFAKSIRWEKDNKIETCSMKRKYIYE